MRRDTLRIRTGLVWSAALVLAVPGTGADPANAQVPDHNSAGIHWARDVAPYMKEGKLRLRLAGGQSITVRDPEAQITGIRYSRSSRGEAGEVAWDDLRAIEIRRTHAGTGAAVGGFVLGTAGLVLGAVASGECSGAPFTIEFCGASAGDVFLITAVGAASGVVLGAAIGVLIPNWKTVYRKPKGLSSVTPVIGPGAGEFGLRVKLRPGP